MQNAGIHCVPGQGGSGPQSEVPSLSPRPQGVHDLLPTPLVLPQEKPSSVYLLAFPKLAMLLMPSGSSGRGGTRPLEENTQVRDEVVFEQQRQLRMPHLHEVTSRPWPRGHIAQLPGEHEVKSLRTQDLRLSLAESQV